MACRSESVAAISRTSSRRFLIARITGSSRPNSARVPVTTAMRKFDRDPLEAPLDEIVVRLDPSVSPQAAAVAIDNLLDRLHAGADDYELVVPEALLEQSQRTQRLFNIVMGCIAGISLLVGGIGIMNIMLVSVTERTREIGIRKALGAKRRAILIQFLLEAVILCNIGGLIGVVVGFGLGNLVAVFTEFEVHVPLEWAVIGLLFCTTVGLVAGMWPAVRASRLLPIEALAQE